MKKWCLMVLAALCLLIPTVGSAQGLPDFLQAVQTGLSEGTMTPMDRRFCLLFCFITESSMDANIRQWGAVRRPGTFFIIIPVYSPNFQPFVKKLFV